VIADNRHGKRDPGPQWGRRIIWGNHRIGGGELRAAATAWRVDVTWGTPLTPEGAPVAWGTAVDREGRNIVWGTGAEREDANIVWGTECGGRDCDNIVWGTDSEGDNIVWGTSGEGDNIVWGTSILGDSDYIVWAPPAIRRLYRLVTTVVDPETR